MAKRLLNAFIRPQVLLVVISLSIFPALMSQALAADMVETYEYDNLRRVTLANYGDGDVLIAYEYDDAGNRHEKSASLRDTDSDSMPDYWEKIYSLNWNNPGDASQDAEGDGLTNLAEYNHKTDPTDSDTDGDNWSDGAEVSAGTDPPRPKLPPHRWSPGSGNDTRWICPNFAVAAWHWHNWNKEKKGGHPVS